VNDVESTLTRCFQAVFPSLPAADVPEATPETVEEWDSVAFVTLVTLIEDELAIEIDFEDLEHLTSFAALATYAAERT